MPMDSLGELTQQLQHLLKIRSFNHLQIPPEFSMIYIIFRMTSRRRFFILIIRFFFGFIFIYFVGLDRTSSTLFDEFESEVAFKSTHYDIFYYKTDIKTCQWKNTSLKTIDKQYPEDIIRLYVYNLP